MATTAAFGLRALAAATVVTALLAPSALHAQEGDPYTLETMQELNEDLKALWMDIQIEQIEFLKLDKDKEHSGARIHRQPFRWVANDVRRNADGRNLTYLVDQDGLPGIGPEEAIDRAMATWASGKCLRKADVVKRTDTGADADLFDGLLGYGGLGDHRLGGIVHAGWMPPDFFDAVGGPGRGETVLAFSVTFIYVGADGEPTDVDGNGYLDVATSEIYYNGAFAWLLDEGDGGGFDVESVALHEIGHSLGLGHTAPEADAVMRPVYSGVNRSVQDLDGAALCSIWGRWPK
ncbi:MAG TPA: matrixin family metalloprotease [Thermoanaerobaculia bacterium]|nr:matrixin family metalloprotease [Thermoanaerobaculia bacterium]